MNEWIDKLPGRGFSLNKFSFISREDPQMLKTKAWNALHLNMIKTFWTWLWMKLSDSRVDIPYHSV